MGLSNEDCLQYLRNAGDEMEVNDYIVSYAEKRNGNVDLSLVQAFRREVSGANGSLDDETMNQVVEYVNSEIKEGRAALLRENLNLGFDPSLDELGLF